MSEFNNRIDVQRQILRLVNRSAWPMEPLCGLSGGAIDRWIARNALDSNAPLVELIRSAAAQLFFLANQSQEQITDEYQLRSQRISVLVTEIATQMELITASERTDSHGEGAN